MLNKEQFSALHYTAPGTDLTLGLPKNHVWESAGAINAQGEGFLPNMPTEEVSQHLIFVAQMVMSLLQNRLAIMEISSRELK